MSELPSVAEVETFVRSAVSTRRFLHVQGVVQTAEGLALQYGADAKKAVVAAWLHDVVKECEQDELLKLADQFGIIFSELELKIPAFWHASVGAAFARRQFEIVDLDVLAAIRYHTTARPGMSLLEQIVFLADLIEPGRRFPDVEQLRELSNRDMGRALLAALDNKIVRVVTRGTLLHPDTLAARNDLLLRIADDAV